MNLRYILPVIMFCTGLFIISCKKNNDNASGIPVITRVTTSIDHQDNIEIGALNQWVIIHGQNLTNTQSLSFDGLQVDTKDIYARDTLISVRIPRQIPSERTHKITVVTNSGTATYDFTINLPELKFSRLRNEYTGEGDTLEIEGENFDLYFTAQDVVVTFSGGSTANIVTLSSNKMQLIVPAGAAVGPITVKGGEPLFSEIVTNSSWYMDDRNVLIVDPVIVPSEGLAATHQDFPNNHAPMLVKQGEYPAWAWDTFLSAYINYPADATAANLSNYVMKFEMNTKTPIAKGDIVFRLGNNNYYRWPYSYFGPVINTNNQWETISIPLNIILADASDHDYIQLILSDGETRINNFAMSNFRIVPKN